MFDARLLARLRGHETHIMTAVPSVGRSAGTAHGRWGRLVRAVAAMGLGLALGAANGPLNLPKPVGEVVLILSGEISNTNAPGRAEFDVPMLKALGLRSLETTSPWTDGKHRFEGVLAKDVLMAVGARGPNVVARGLHDYAINIPVADLVRYPVLLAFSRDGAALRMREGGPIQIVYPRDQFPELNAPIYARRAVGTLAELVVR